MPNRRRIATTWIPSQEPELEAYIAAHSDNLSAALRRALKAGIGLVDHDDKRLERIESKIDLLLSGASQRNVIDKVEAGGEVGIDSLPKSVLSNLKGLSERS